MTNPFTTSSLGDMKQATSVFSWQNTCIYSVAWALGASAILLLPSSASSQDDKPETAAAAEITEPVEVRPIDGDLPVGRAWEYSHYRVRVWICSDGSAEANNGLQVLPDQLRRLAQSCDPSGWEVMPEAAPAFWRWKCLAELDEPAQTLTKIGSAPELVHDDKLTVILLNGGPLGIRCSVRELDLNTNQWGALLEENIEQRDQLGDAVFSMLRTTFMPLARIDRVTEDNEVFMRVRGANLCQFASYNPEGSDWIVKLNIDSPVWIRPDDCFIPVLRKTDRDNKLVSQEPVEFTFIKVDPAGPPRDEVAEKVADAPVTEPVDAAPAASPEGKAATNGDSGSEADKSPPEQTEPPAAEKTTAQEFNLGVDHAAIFGRVHSSFRAPLVARKSKRLEKLALVIRPPKGVTTLRLRAADATQQPMEGIEIWSHPLDAGKDEGWEKLGKTDWRGMIKIPPAVEGLRMIYMKRGARALMKIPIMPGFYSLVESTIVNDEARLFAEGVITGMSNEILDVVAQREIHEKMISDYLAENNPESLEKAKDELELYRALPTSQQLSSRLSNEKSRLQVQAKDKREEQFINNMFDSLEAVLTKFVGKSKAMELLARIQSQSGMSLDSPSRDPAGVNLEDPDNPEAASPQKPAPVDPNAPDPFGGSGG